MAKLICEKCMDVFHAARPAECSTCGAECHDFSNNDEFLVRETQRAIADRQAAGLEGLVGGLNSVVINTEPDRQEAAVAELLQFTGLELETSFEDSDFVTCVLKTHGSADFLVQSRKTDNPFPSPADCPKAGHLPNTRLETLVFDVTDLDLYVRLQRDRGVQFLTDEIIRTDKFLFIQTIPSTFTEMSTGFIQWLQPGRVYAAPSCRPVAWNFDVPHGPLMKNVKELDHVAVRVEARDRDSAILEFMVLTNYNFEFSIYVKLFNSITNVSRLTGEDFALVFTSGIRPFEDDETSGPTEKFVHNYGRRAHHMAFRTEHIEQTFADLADRGMEFLIGLIGSEAEGLKQTFSAASENTLIVNEYIRRYGDFDGFFSPNNVMLLTGATGRQ